MKIANYGLDELLDTINDSPEPLTGLQDLVNTNIYARFWLEQAVNDKFIEFDLDELNYKISTYHPSMAGQLLLNRNTVKVYSEIIVNEKVLLKNRRYQCKSMIDMLSGGEGQLFVAILKKNVPAMYDNITFEMINTALNTALNTK